MEFIENQKFGNGKLLIIFACNLIVLWRESLLPEGDTLCLTLDKALADV